MRRQFPGGIHRIEYGTTLIEFEIIYSARKTLAVSVLPDGSVVLQSPEGVPVSHLSEMVQRRAGWILKQRRHFQSLERPIHPPRQYVSGEACRFLGRQLRLKVIESSVTRVRRSRTLLVVETRNPDDTTAVGELVAEWFSHQAERIFTERVDICYRHVAHWGRPMPTLAVRPMKARWGSLTSKGTLTLNRKLIQAPVELIDYVILHELCHLRELHHGPAFYQLLDQVLPSWRDLRHKLNIYDFI